MVLQVPTLPQPYCCRFFAELCRKIGNMVGHGGLCLVSLMLESTGFPAQSRTPAGANLPHRGARKPPPG